MQEFSDLLKTLKEIGLLQYLLIPISFIILLILLKKYVFTGSGNAISATGIFLKGILLEYMDNEKNGVKSQANIEFRLGELCDKFDKIVEGLFENRRHIEGKIDYLETIVETHAMETHNLILLLKKRSDPIQEALNMVDTQYFKAQQPQEKTP